ncbi:CDP-diacylglycerol--glycerol-3-phosphate 3-phosphatidyltransferase [Ascosphaera atra]|nr:CDP-diacylglycerol--glycerol-3-phosphate 3-phosphatidyltransferase [Ascosphaera atra]
MTWPNAAPHPLTSTENFITHSSAILTPLIKPIGQGSTKPISEGSTFVYPVSQFTPLMHEDQSTEFPAVTTILSSLAEQATLRGSKWMFTAGYFNMHPTVSSLLISSATKEAEKASQDPHCTVLTASPWANGFYGSKGVSGMLPAAYTHLAIRFLERVAAAGRKDTIVLKEWRRGTVGQPNGWTYHAKGLWITLPGEKDPSLTIVGSSNYTKRSYNLDIEVGAVVVTTDDTLRKRLGEETRWLQKHASTVDKADLRKPEREVGWHVRLAMKIVELVGGAL